MADENEIQEPAPDQETQVGPEVGPSRAKRFLDKAGGYVRQKLETKSSDSQPSQSSEKKKSDTGDPRLDAFYDLAHEINNAIMDMLKSGVLKAYDTAKEAYDTSKGPDKSKSTPVEEESQSASKVATKSDSSLSNDDGLQQDVSTSQQKSDSTSVETDDQSMTASQSASVSPTSTMTALSPTTTQTQSLGDTSSYDNAVSAKNGKGNEASGPDLDKDLDKQAVDTPKPTSP